MWKTNSQCQIANLLELNRSITCRIINHYKQCSSVENWPQSRHCRRMQNVGWINMPQNYVPWNLIDVYIEVCLFVILYYEQTYCEVTRLRVRALQHLLLLNLWHDDAVYKFSFHLPLPTNVQKFCGARRLSVCLFVSRISQNVVDRYEPNVVEW